ncbi:DUF1694 domain-containing protein [uncultured Cetobacterium sp.]|uniref:DUF1694 domain-containing protein n=1 Tax=uncultured Cetobacterium sp. TaxID=527638 RepID=UPI0026205C53|nr:DUF1694 domain-containing protein [uncultured Cetobacterium sp.]
MIILVDDIINEREKAKLHFIKIQSQKLDYLGEFKENIIVALEKQEIERNIIHNEIKEAMSDSRAVLLKLRRDIPFDCIKPYIEEAEKIGLRYTLVDDITFRGNIGLVVVSQEPLDNEDKNVVVESAAKVFIDAGLSEGFIYAEGQKICPEHYKELEEKLPEYLDRFQEMNFFDRLFGKVCPIDRFDKKER